MDGQISSDNPFIAKNSRAQNHNLEDGFYSASFTEDGKYEDNHGDGGISANLIANQSQLNHQEARFGQQNYEDEENVGVKKESKGNNYISKV